jgi:hypothetical protein
MGPIVPWWKVKDINVAEQIPVYKEVYELICIRKNGDLVYRLQR